MKRLILATVQILLTLQIFSQQFAVSYSETAYNKTFSGKVFLYLSKEDRQPKDAMVGLEAFPCFAIDVKNIKPGQAVLFDDKAISYPAVISDLERNEYYVQAVWDRDLGGRAISGSLGNIYSKSIKVKLTKDRKKIFSINCDQVIPEQVFKDTKFVKELKVQSTLLSAFLIEKYLQWQKENKKGF
jgi:hypothetical protein